MKTARTLGDFIAIIFASALLWAALASAETPLGPPPPTRVNNVVDTLHGVPISDSYRWLEDNSSKEVQDWTASQHDYFQKYVDDFPGRDTIKAELMRLLEVGSFGSPTVRGDRYFVSRRSGSQNNAVLFMQRGLKGRPEVLIDPNTFSADGTVAMDWSYLSDDGSLITYGTSASGTEKSTLFVKRTADKTMLSDTIPYTRSAAVAWLPDNSGFYYTRFPAPGSVPAGDENYFRKVYLHKLGSSWEKDPLVFSYDADKTAWPNVVTSPDGRWLVVAVSLGWSRTEVFLKDLNNKDDKAGFVTVVNDRAANFDVIPLNDRFIVSTNDGAPRYRIMVGHYDAPSPNHWQVVVPEADQTISETAIIANHLIVNSLKNAYSHLTVYTLDGKLIRELPMPTLGTISGLGGEWNGHELFCYFTSFSYPPAVFHYDFAKDSLELFDRLKLDLDLSHLEVKQVWYKSKDSTPVSMFIVAPKGMSLDGSHPTYLDGYGGFNASSTPVFNRSIAIWLMHGGIYALANIRGGGEYGEAWHRAGMLENKQNTFDDFIAAAEYLVREKYTSPEKLVLYGGSNGGLLIGAVITQRPDICAAAICDVPLLDMIRYQKFRIASLWIPEYGSSDDSIQFKYILKYSPYQNVHKGVKYPAILFKAGDSDNRVDPLHARKMAALMQASSSSGRPILLRVDSKSGHGQGKPLSKVADEITDQWCFVFKALGMKL